MHKFPLKWKKAAGALAHVLSYIWRYQFTAQTDINFQFIVNSNTGKVLKTWVGVIGVWETSIYHFEDIFRFKFFDNHYAMLILLTWPFKR